MKAVVERGPGVRLLTACVQSICGSGEDQLQKPATGMSEAHRRRFSTAASIAEEPEPQQIPSTLVPGAIQTPSSATRGSGVKPPLGATTTATQPAGMAKERVVKPSLLSPVVQHFEAAVQGNDSGGSGETREVKRVAFIDGLEEYAKLLDAMGGDMGSYLAANTKKLRSSKADKSKVGYREWLLTELPVHGSNGYKEYVDESAWMANLWIGWTLEFFVEMFARLHEGKDTKQSVDLAYKQTLYNHHNFFQRTAFNAAVRQLPERAKILNRLQGSGTSEDVKRELGNFVRLGRPLAAFCSKTNEELDLRLQAERKAYLKK